MSNSEKFFRSLQCDRLRVHKHFMVSLVLLYLTTIIYFEPYTHHSSFIWYKSQPWLCNSVLVLLMFCFQSPIFWMFIEGIYLHSRVSTNIFNSSAPFSIYYLIGWGENLPILLLLKIFSVFNTFSCPHCIHYKLCFIFLPRWFYIFTSNQLHHQLF